MSTAPTVAAIDIGTNSVKLLVRHGSDRFSHAVAVRLGEGMHATRELQPEPIARTLDALRRLRSLADERGVARLGVVATSATRDARNRDAFLDAAAEILGTRPIVLSGEDEGRLAYSGSCIDLPDGVGSPRLVVDIGGGSTELMVGAGDALSVASIDLGCVRLTESHLRSDPPRPDELTNAIGLVQDHLDDVIRDLPDILDVASIVGIGGTITTVAAVEVGIADYEALHGFWLSRHAAEDVFRTLATERLSDRVHNPGLPADRATVIVGGLCVLVAVLRKLRADGLTLSRRAAVDGICAALVEDRWPLPNTAP